MKCTSPRIVGTMEAIHQIIDANINRVTEGLRVIEDYTRFIAGHKIFTDQLSAIRKQIHRSETNKSAHLHIRDTGKDMRAKEPPAKRKDIADLLTANFKRVEEGLRVLEEYTGLSMYSTIRYDVYQLEKEIVLTLLKKKIEAGVYLISHDPSILEKGLNWGASCIQLRDKESSKSDLLKKAIRVKKMSSQYEIPFIVNDYIDIALMVDADGLHTGQDDLPIPALRKLMGPHKLLGRTTHTLQQGLQAQKEGADYVSVGPIWETPSKPGRKGIGFQYLKKASSSLEIPYVAIGGICLDNVGQVLEFSPPMVGVIRDYENIKAFQRKMTEIPFYFQEI
ncbi:MAG: thiamine phosphate synthase [Candidatus Margulisbacteria bacterium]|nr:thiamine phosphate synthase [Candidatus Margulisiibacteriota bacterium]